MTEVESLTDKPTVWFHSIAPSQSSFSIVINPRLSSLPPSPSSTQMEPPAKPTSKPLQQTQLTLQVAANITMNMAPTARESKCPLQRGSNRPFVDPLFLSSFLNTRVPLRELFQVMPNLCHDLGGLETAKMGQTSVDEMLQIFLGFGHRMQEEPSNRHLGAVILSYSCNERAEIRRLHDRLSSAEAPHNHFRHQLCIT